MKKYLDLSDEEVEKEMELINLSITDDNANKV
jgi:hypothetical protein